MRNDGFRGPARQGGWLGALIGGAVSLLSARSTDRRARRADARRNVLEERSLALSEKADERAQSLYEHYRSNYQPREEDLLRDVFDHEESPTIAANRASADVRQAGENARAMSERRLRRLGVDPSSGNYAALEGERSLNEAKIEAGARTGARERTRDRNLNRQLSVIGLGRNLPSTAGYLGSQAQYGVSGAASRAAGYADTERSLAYEAGSAFGENLGTLIDEVTEAWKKRRSLNSGTPIQV